MYVWESVFGVEGFILGLMMVNEYIDSKYKMLRWMYTEAADCERCQRVMNCRLSTSWIICLCVIMLLEQPVGGRSLSARCAPPPALCRLLLLLLLLAETPLALLSISRLWCEIRRRRCDLRGHSALLSEALWRRLLTCCCFTRTDGGLKLVQQRDFRYTSSGLWPVFIRTIFSRTRSLCKLRPTELHLCSSQLVPEY